MKITHIHIERFRGFQNEDFEVGSLLTAIAGQNGTQKSTLLGIITQTFTLKTEDSMRALNPQLHSRSATYIKRNGLLIRKITIKSSRPFQCAYHPLTP